MLGLREDRISIERVIVSVLERQPVGAIRADGEEAAWGCKTGAERIDRRVARRQGIKELVQILPGSIELDRGDRPTHKPRCDGRVASDFVGFRYLGLLRQRRAAKVGRAVGREELR